MADFSTCTKMSCRTVTDGIVPRCPTCGARTLTSRRARILGWVLVGCGVFLLGVMGYITVMLYPSLTHPGEEIAGGSRFSGSPEQAASTLNLFYIVIAFGALCIANGAWQVIKGKRNIAFMIVTLLLAAVLYFTAQETKTVLSNGSEASSV